MSAAGRQAREPGVSLRSVVRSVMVWPVATIESDATLSEAAEALAADEVGALVVTEGGRLAGIVSERDVVAHLAAGADLLRLRVGDVMMTDLVSVGPGDEVRVAARLMDEARVRHLPVLDGAEVAGIISMRDLFVVLLDSLDGDG